MKPFSAGIKMPRWGLRVEESALPARVEQPSPSTSKALVFVREAGRQLIRETCCRNRQTAAFQLGKVQAAGGQVAFVDRSANNIRVAIRRRKADFDLEGYRVTTGRDVPEELETVGLDRWPERQILS